jgi:hypothetical protein
LRSGMGSGEPGFFPRESVAQPSAIGKHRAQYMDAADPAPARAKLHSLHRLQHQPGMTRRGKLLLARGNRQAAPRAVREGRRGFVVGVPAARTPKHPRGLGQRVHDHLLVLAATQRPCPRGRPGEGLPREAVRACPKTPSRVFSASAPVELAQ